MLLVRHLCKLILELMIRDGRCLQDASQLIHAKLVQIFLASLCATMFQHVQVQDASSLIREDHDILYLLHYLLELRRCGFNAEFRGNTSAENGAATHNESLTGFVRTFRCF